jgi:capsular exopolysaccharide synthesis family protein
VLSDKLKKTTGKTVLITSSISGEGKTLIASNLALIIATSNKKVLLIGADIRNPSLGNFYGKLKKEADREMGSQNKGLTEYLHNKSIGLNEIVSSHEIEGIPVDVIFSGKIPPNPAELILSERLGYLFDKVSEKYDYIIVDSAPMMLVADTISIAKYADQTLYVTKAAYTEKRVIDYPIKVKKEGKITNLAFIVNNVKAADLGYGGSYGYGYNKKKKWWQRRPFSRS